MSGNLFQQATVWQGLASLIPAALAVLALIVLALVATAAIRCLSWAWLRLKARSPRVQISPFTWAASGDGERDATWITSLFREQLSGLRLDPLDPLPERAPGAQAVQIVEGVGQGLGKKFDLGAALGRLYRAAFPDAAYEVWGTLRPLTADGGRISIQLVDRARGNQTLVSLAADEGSWQESAAQAAMAVAGALYPRVLERYKGPWTLWRRPVPPQLVRCYHRARRHEAANRLEQSLGAYHDALSLDPLNPHLRLKIAMLQERLGLDLDAWITYNAIIDESDRDAWKGADRRVRLLALYRVAILLCNGRIASKWMTVRKHRDEMKRKREQREAAGKRVEEGPGAKVNPLEELTVALERDPLIKDGYWDRLQARLQARTPSDLTRKLVRGSATTLLNDLPDWDSKPDPKDWIKGRFLPEQIDPRKHDEETKRIKEVLEIVGLRRLEDLDARLRLRPPLRLWRISAWQVRRPPLRQWPHRREFSRAAVRVSKRLTRLRIVASTRRRLEADPRGATAVSAELAEVREAHEALTSRWPFPAVNAWADAIRLLRPRRRWADRREDSWQLHYNAACTVASTLLEGSLLVEMENSPTVLPGKTSRHELVEAAIDQLEEYAHRAGSSRVAEQTDWLALEDPDLAGLFDESAFRLWAGHHLPKALPRTRPSRDLDPSKVAALMLRQGARAFAKTWRERAAVERLEPAATATWWREEQRAWQGLLAACARHESWEGRLQFLKDLEGCLGAAGASERIEFAHDRRDHAEHASEPASRLLKPIEGLVGKRRNGAPPPEGTLSSWVEKRAGLTLAASEAAPRNGWSTRRWSTETERNEAQRAARLWDGLAAAMEIELEGDSRGARAAVRALAGILPAG